MAYPGASDKYSLEVRTPLGVLVRTTVDYWLYLITVKHPAMKGKEEIVKAVLKAPDEIRNSKSDKDVFLYYGWHTRLYCVVVKHEGNSGFKMTAYPVDKVKEGETIWKK